MEPPYTACLPGELKICIVHLLGKADLKRIRCVSKAWCDLATIPLFDRIYVSPRKKDIEVYENITKHPVLRAVVKELIYDATRFHKITLYEYCNQMIRYLCMLSWRWRKKEWKFQSPDLHINEILNGSVNRSSPFPENMHRVTQDHINDTFITEGFKAYNECADYEEESLQTGVFFKILSSELRQLHRLRSVLLCSNLWHKWLNEMNVLNPSTLSGHLPGSPCNRSWNPLQLRTLPWRNDEQRSQDVCDGFLVLTRALAVSESKMVSFGFSSSGVFESLRPYTLVAPTLEPGLLTDAFSAYSGLEVLTLDIEPIIMQDCSFQWPWHVNNGRPIPVLLVLLSQMWKLKELSLYSRWRPSGGIGQPELAKFLLDQVFPVDSRWPDLAKLRLKGFPLNGYTILHLLCLQMPRLSCLALENVNLLQGTWEDIIEWLRRRGLRQLDLRGYLINADETVFTPESQEPSYTDETMLGKIKSYVELGGRHPCLPPDVDDASAERYYLDMCSEELLKKIDCDGHTLGPSLEQLGNKPIERKALLTVI